MDETSRKSIRAGLALGAAALLCATSAAAQTLYKLIDKNGKVTYSESPPKEFDGKVIRMDIDPKANTATLPKPSASPAQETESEKIIRRPTPATGGGDKVSAARDKLEAAKKALKDAQDNPGESDVARMGNKGGGTRPVPTEEYQKRLDVLQEGVRKAEEELRVAEGR